MKQLKNILIICILENLFLKYFVDLDIYVCMCVCVYIYIYICKYVCIYITLS